MDPPGLLPRAKRLGVGAQASVTRDAGDADRLLAEGIAAQIADPILGGSEIAQIAERLLTSPDTEQLGRRLLEGPELERLTAGVLESTRTEAARERFPRVAELPFDIAYKLMAPASAPAAA
jgi:hypothetical protein